MISAESTGHTGPERGFVPISDDQLLEHAQRVNGQVVVITGAANGIGREAAVRFASAGAKIVIGDLDVPAAERTVADIRASGGEATCIKCDVTIWEDQVGLFDLAVQTFSSVDVVVANAGVGEISPFTQVVLNSDGKPKRPSMLPVEVNLLGATYTIQLAQHYLLMGGSTSAPMKQSLKTIIVLGSMASWVGNDLIPVYVATKHGILGLVRSLEPILSAQGIRIAVICPFFAETAILRRVFPPLVRLVFAGVPFTPVPRISATILYVASNPDERASGSAYLLLDNGPAYEVPREEFKVGVYEKLDEKANSFFQPLTGLAYTSKVIEDVVGAFGLRPITISTAIAMAVACTTWIYKSR